MANLVLIETAGNQRYIFATNRRRENVGASQLIHEAGDNWVRDALQYHLDAQPPNITSGKALVRLNDAAAGRDLVRRVTLNALRYAPGLDVCGVVSRDIDLDRCPLHEASTEVHSRISEARPRRPCDSTQLPQDHDFSFRLTSIQSSHPQGPHPPLFDPVDHVTHHRIVRIQPVLAGLEECNRVSFAMNLVRQVTPR